MRRDWSAAAGKLADEQCCRVCGYHSVDPAHIIPRSRGGDDVAENIVPLCRSCHTAYDAGQLELLPVLARQEEVHAVELVGLGEAYRRTTTLEGEPWEP